MKKNLLIFCLFFLTVPFAIQSAWFGSHPDNNAQDLTIKALELASILDQKSNSMFGNLFEPTAEPKKAKTVQPKKEISLLEKINLLRDNITAIKHDSLNPIKRFLNPTIKLLGKTEDASSPTFAVDKVTILKQLQEIYKLCFTGLQLNKGLFNTKKPYLEINNTQFKGLEKSEKSIVDDIKNILALLWIQFIEKYGNEVVEISFQRQGSTEQKLNFAALRWAYFTAHSGSDFTENQILNDYSKPCISKIFKQITSDAQLLLQEINNAALDINLNKCNFLASLKPKLSKLYQLLMLNTQIKDKYFQLFPEFQDAFPVIERAIPGKKPELPLELANTLTSLAEVWLKLINNTIITKEETVLLTYPKIIDPTSKTAIEIASASWMHTTACAGYSNWSYNISYEQLIQEPTIWESYVSWATSLPEKARGLVNKFFNWKDSSFDPSIFNN